MTATLRGGSPIAHGAGRGTVDEGLSQRNKNSARSFADAVIAYIKNDLPNIIVIREIISHAALNYLPEYDMIREIISGLRVIVCGTSTTQN